MHQTGRRAEAETRFREAEQMQAEHQPDYPLLNGVDGFQYCDLLLAAPERAAWQTILGGASVPASRESEKRLVSSLAPPEMENALQSCRAVSQRAAQTLQWEEGRLLDIALDHFTLGRAALYAAMLESPNSAFRVPHSELDSAVAGLRRAGQQFLLVRSLLTRAWCSFAKATEHRLRGRDGEASDCLAQSQADLDEAWEIAERGPMKLFLADIHLHRARLFFREKEYPKEWISPQADLAAAEKLINACSYHRRDQELADAKKAILGSP